MNKKCILLGVSALALAASASTGISTEPQTGGFYFDAMKDAIIEVIDENQKLINQTPSGDVKDQELESKAYYKEAYSTFKKIAGSDFSSKRFADETNPEVIAHTLAAMLQAGRVTTAKAQGAINTEADGTTVKKKFIPAVFGLQVAAKFKEKTGAGLKQTTLGKNDYTARNESNTPDEWEATILAKFQTADWPLNEGVGLSSGAAFRYMKPIYIKQACLSCHGTPIGEKGPYGHAKEGYEVGDIRGAISVTIPTGVRG